MINLKKFKRFLYKSLLQNFQYNKENNTYTFFSDILFFKGFSEISNINKENKRKFIISKLQGFYFILYNTIYLIIIFCSIICFLFYFIISFSVFRYFIDPKFFITFVKYSWIFPLIYSIFLLIYGITNLKITNLNQNSRKIFKINLIKEINCMSLYFLFQNHLNFCPSLALTYIYIYLFRNL